jgi:hypothetical protein
VVFQNQMLLKVFDTQPCVQSIESICELQHCLAPLLPQCGPSHVLVIIFTNKVILFLDRIHTKKSQVASAPYIPDSSMEILIFLPVSFPPMFDMGEFLKECEGDLLPVGKIVNREVTFYHI